MGIGFRMARNCYNELEKGIRNVYPNQEFLQHFLPKG
nr:MAG TPA: hypothetical protein [Caudoviricetes sp.]